MATRKTPRASVPAHVPRSPVPVLGNMRWSDAGDRIIAVGDPTLGRSVKRAAKTSGNKKFSLFNLGGKKPDPVYKYAEHAFGYIPKAAGNDGLVDVTDAGNIIADVALKNTAIKLTLDRLRVFAYPGGGEHSILFDFYAQHLTTSGDSQDVHFTQQYRVKEGGGAGISGYPVFVGLKVGTEGVSFKCYTVNVGNSDDKKVLSFLGNDVFKKGLQLINGVNPALPIVTGFATGIIEAFAKRNENVPVQDFYLGLDFSGIATRAQLREGSYIAVQVPDASAWDWTQWAFKPTNGQVVSRAEPTKGVPLNYVVFSVSKLATA